MYGKKIFTFIIVLFLLPIVFFPSAAAFTWTETYTETLDTSQTEAGEGNGDAAGLGPYLIIGIEDTDAGNLYFYRCIVSSGSCSRVVMADNAAATKYDWDIVQETSGDSNNVIACYSSGVDAGVFRRSTNGGQSWSISDSPTLFSCGVDKVGSKVWIAGANSTEVAADDFGVSVSNNGGTSWGTIYYVNFVGSLEDSTGFDADINIAAKNSTDVMMVGTSSSSSNLVRCYSTTGGDSSTEWTCASLGINGLSNKLLYDDATAKWHGIATSDSGSTVTYYTFDSVDGLPTTTTISGSESGTSTASIYVLNSTSIIAVWEDSIGTDGFATFSISHDLGTTWSTPENAITETNGAGGNFLDTIGVTFSSGEALVGYGLVTSATETDDLVFHAAKATISQQVTESGSVTLTNLVGFDISPDGGIAVSRHEGGDDVSVHDGGTGDLLGGPIETNCDLGGYEDAVMAKGVFQGNGNALIGFLNCDALGDSQYFSIRDTDGSVPESSDFASAFGDPEPCGTGSWGQYEAGSALCPYDIDLADSFDEPADSGLGQLGQVHDWPIDYSNNEREANDLDRRQVSWAFASQQCNNPPTGSTYCDGVEAGVVGIAMATFKDFETDDFNQDFEEVDSDESVNDFCLGLDVDEYYLAAASNQGSHTYSVLFDNNANGINVLDATIGAASGNMGAGAGIACGGGQILLGTNSGTIALYTRTGVFIDSITGVDPTTRNVAISEEFVGPGGPTTGPDRVGTICSTAMAGTNFCVQYGAYFEDSDNTIHILNLTGGSMNEVSSFPGRSTGSHHSLRMDQTSQNSWESTSTGWSRFEITEVTTVEPVTFPSDEEAEEPPGSVDPNAVSAEDVENFLQSKTFVGILITLAIAIFGFVLGGRVYHAGTGAMLGAALGFSASAFMGFFHPIVFLATIILAGIVVYRRFF